MAGPRALLRSYVALDRGVWVLAGARAINTMGFSMVMPFMAMYLVEQRGASGTDYGLLYLVAGLASSVANAYSGELSDRIGRKSVLVGALRARFVNFVVLGVSVILHAPVWVLGLLVVVNAILRAFFDPVAQAAITDVCDPTQRTAAFGLQRIGINVGWAMGPAIGGTLAAQVSYGSLFLASSVFTLAASIAVGRLAHLPRHEIPAQERLTLASVRAAARANPAFFVYLLLVLAGSICTVQLFSTLSVFARTVLDLPERDIGLVYTVNGLLVVLLQIPAVAIIERRGLGPVLVGGPVLYAAGFLAVGHAESFLSLAGAVVLITAGEVVFAPALADMAAQLGDPRRMGRAFGLFGLMQQLGFSLGPLAGGLAYDHLRHDPAGMWGVIAASMLVAGVGFAWFGRHFRARLASGMGAS